MGITEYVASRHTFGILICVIHDGVNVGALTLARRLQAATATVCGLYAHATAAAAATTDTLFARVAPQYRMILHICASNKATPQPLLCVSGPPEAVSVLRSVFASTETAVVATGDSDLRVSISGPGLDEASIRNQIADILAGAVLRLAGTTGPNSAGR